MIFQSLPSVPLTSHTVLLLTDVCLTSLWKFYKPYFVYKSQALSAKFSRVIPDERHCRTKEHGIWRLLLLDLVELLLDGQFQAGAQPETENTHHAGLSRTSSRKLNHVGPLHSSANPGTKSASLTPSQFSLV